MRQKKKRKLAKRILVGIALLLIFWIIKELLDYIHNLIEMNMILKRNYIDSINQVHSLQETINRQSDIIHNQQEQLHSISREFRLKINGESFNASPVIEIIHNEELVRPIEQLNTGGAVIVGGLTIVVGLLKTLVPSF